MLFLMMSEYLLGDDRVQESVALLWLACFSSECELPVLVRSLMFRCGGACHRTSMTGVLECRMSVCIWGFLLVCVAQTWQGCYLSLVYSNSQIACSSIIVFYVINNCALQILQVSDFHFSLGSSDSCA